MTASVMRLAVLLIAPGVCAATHYLIANKMTHSATHFIPAPEQSAQSSQVVANKVDISMEEFQRVVAGRQAVIIDAREPNEFEAGHIPGARNFYVNAVEADVTIVTSQIDPLADIVVYCGGKECEDSSRLFDILKQLLGYANVRLFRGGMADWEAAKLPIERGKGPS